MADLLDVNQLQASGALRGGAGQGGPGLHLHLKDLYRKVRSLSKNGKAMSVHRLKFLEVVGQLTRVRFFFVVCNRYRLHGMLVSSIFLVPLCATKVL